MPTGIAAPEHEMPRQAIGGAADGAEPQAGPAGPKAIVPVADFIARGVSPIVTSLSIAVPRPMTVPAPTRVRSRT